MGVWHQQGAFLTSLVTGLRLGSQIRGFIMGMVIVATTVIRDINGLGFC